MVRAVETKTSTARAPRPSNRPAHDARYRAHENSEGKSATAKIPHWLLPARRSLPAERRSFLYVEIERVAAALSVIIDLSPPSPECHPLISKVMGATMRVPFLSCFSSRGVDLVVGGRQQVDGQQIRREL